MVAQFVWDQGDVTNPQQGRDAVDHAIATFGRIDVLVNNAGYGMMGAIEEVTDAEVRQQYETHIPHFDFNSDRSTRNLVSSEIVVSATICILATAA